MVLRERPAERAQPIASERAVHGRLLVQMSRGVATTTKLACRRVDQLAAHQRCDALRLLCAARLFCEASLFDHARLLNEASLLSETCFLGQSSFLGTSRFLGQSSFLGTPCFLGQSSLLGQSGLFGASSLLSSARSSCLRVAARAESVARRRAKQITASRTAWKRENISIAAAAAAACRCGRRRRRRRRSGGRGRGSMRDAVRRAEAVSAHSAAELTAIGAAQSSDCQRIQRSCCRAAVDRRRHRSHREHRGARRCSSRGSSRRSRRGRRAGAVAWLQTTVDGNGSTAHLIRNECSCAKQGVGEGAG